MGHPWDFIAKSENWKLSNASTGGFLVLCYNEQPPEAINRADVWELVWSKAKAGSEPHMAALAYLSVHGIAEYRGIVEHHATLDRVRDLRRLCTSDDKLIRELASNALEDIPLQVLQRVPREG